MSRLSKQTASLPTQLATATWTHGGVYKKKIYFPVARYDDPTKVTLEFGIGCWNAETDTSCPFVSLPGSPSVPYSSGTYFGSDGTYLGGYLVGVRADPGNPSHMLVYAQEQGLLRRRFRRRGAGLRRLVDAGDDQPRRQCSLSRHHRRGERHACVRRQLVGTSVLS